MNTFTRSHVLALVVLQWVALYWASHRVVLVAGARQHSQPLDALQPFVEPELNRTQATASPKLARTPQQQPTALGGLESAPSAQRQATANRSAVHLPAPGPSTIAGTTPTLAGVRARWSQLERSVGDSLLTSAQQLRQTLGDLEAGGPPAGAGRRPAGAKRISLSGPCRGALFELLEALGEQKLWASRMVDSSAARLPAGLLEGTLTELGNFDECLSIRPKLDGSPMAAQYCSIQIKPPLVGRPRLHTACNRLPALVASQTSPNQTSAGAGQWAGASRAIGQLAQHSQAFYYAGLRLGVCVPSKCGQWDLQQLLSGYLANFELLGQVKSCQSAASALSGRSASDNNNNATGADSSLVLGPVRLDVAQQCIA